MVGYFIREIRNQMGLSSTQLADLLEVTPAGVSDWESDRDDPDNATFFHLLECLKIFRCFRYFLKSLGGDSNVV